MLRKKASVDDRLGQLSDGACLLYLLSIPHLDVEGRMDGDPGAVWGTVATCRRRRHPHWTVQAVEGFLAEWQRTTDEDGHPSPLVLWYCVRGHWVCEFLGFKKNQALRADREAPSRFPAPPEDLLSTVPHAVAAWDADPEDQDGPDAVPGPHGERLFPVEAPAEAPAAGNGRFEQNPEPLRSEAEGEVQVQEQPPDQRGPSRARARATSPAALLGEPNPVETPGTLGEVVAAVARRREALASHGPLARLLEVLSDADAQTPRVLHELFDPLGEAAIELARKEILDYGPAIRNPSAYAVGIARRLAGGEKPRRRGARSFASLADERAEMREVFRREATAGG